MITVGEIFQLLNQGAPSVQEEEVVSNAIDILLEDSRTSSVFVVDREKRLKGVIDVQLLIQIAETINSEFDKNENISTDSEAFLHLLSNLLKSYKISQIMKKPVSVEMSQPISHAIFLMKENHLHEIPIVEKDRLVGVLNFCEILYNLKKD